MGTLAHFNLAALAQLHGLKALVETGTAQGDGVAAALAAGFSTIHSVEIIPAVAERARQRFAGRAGVTIWEGDSATELPKILEALPEGPTLFWLDAHFPGAHTGADYAAEPDLERRLPLEREVALIAAARPAARDLVLIDDARIYQPGPYGAGDLPADWPPLAGCVRSLDFVRAAFGATHGVVVDYSDQGYVMVVPKPKLRKAA